MNRTPSALARTIVLATGWSVVGGGLSVGCSDDPYATVHGNVPHNPDYANSVGVEASAPSSQEAQVPNPALDEELQEKPKSEQDADERLPAPAPVTAPSEADEGPSSASPDSPVDNESSALDDGETSGALNGDSTSEDPVSEADDEAAAELPETSIDDAADPPATAPSEDAPGTAEEEPSSFRAGHVESPIGTNLSGITDHDPSWPFVDVMKTSRSWISGNTDGTWDDGRAIDVDANGWPRSLAPNQVAKTLMFWDIDGHYPQGEYTVLYDGVGTLEYFGGAKRTSSVAGREVIEVGPGGIGLSITTVDAANPLRNVRVIMPGGVCSDDSMRYCDADNACGGGATCTSFEDNYETQVFHPQYLKRLETYGVLRFMDWGATNHSTQQTWANRPKPSDARYSVKGAPVEVMTDLANRLGVDAWFTIPHLADDEYVEKYADTVAATLRPDLKAYVEHSNEVWNAMFSQAEHARSRGMALGLASSDYEAQLRYHSQRSVEIFKIFERQFGGLERLVRVMASQAANSWTSSAALEFENAAQYSDAIAIAPYFGGYFGGNDQLSSLRNMTVDQLLDLIEHDAVPETIEWMHEQAQVASTHGVTLIAYEGGQHLAGVAGAEEDAQLNALFDAANRHPRMKTIYAQYLNAWKASGGQLFAHFIDCGRFTKWGRWGSLEFLDQPRAEAPKFDALQTFIEANPIWW